MYSKTYKKKSKKEKSIKNDLDIFKLRRILKILNFRKYYEHKPPYIADN